MFTNHPVKHKLQPVNTTVYLKIPQKQKRKMMLCSCEISLARLDTWGKVSIIKIIQLISTKREMLNSNRLQQEKVNKSDWKTPAKHIQNKKSQLE